ncbi:MAG TPA: TetR/AcrR family transcriptional regulator [Polyangiaceae bacterium LLY-WYZ-14_1]|jgi:AcrR family transcriptional regulator|nr:TetR/AcrR family transcriptional regulator [Polyangiaceae bacterium LLY-WYZ-14_1]
MRYKKSEISAAQIVQAAIRVLARQGYARTSLMDIAREAGMSKGALHYHFASKEALIKVVLETACNAVAARTQIALQPGADLASAIRASIAELWKVRAERTDEALVVADLLAQALYDDGLRPQLADYYRFAASQVQEQLTGYLAALGLRPKVPDEVLPRILIGLLDGLVMQVFVEPDVLEPEQVVQAIETLALSLFEVPPALAAGSGAG